jgi:hypothetical protein
VIRCGDSSQNALPFDVSIAFFTKAIRTRRIKSTTLLAGNMAANRMLTTLPMLAFDAMHGRGAMSVRLTLKPARSRFSSTRGASVGTITSCFE